jgi:YggT family protein
MLIYYIVQIINLLASLITMIVIVQVLLSYFMSPFHPLRSAIDNLVNPMLAPIRRYLPQMGMFDFSPLVLIIVVQVVARILSSLLLSI